MMAEIICPIDLETCSCDCNCQAVLSNGRIITVGTLITSGNQYIFKYTVTNEDPAVSNIIFCIQCPPSRFEANSGNTTIQVTGNPDTTPVPFTQCSPPGCESDAPNRFSVEFEFDFGEEEECCPYQGIKINVNPADGIESLDFNLIFNLPEDISLSFNRGALRLKAGQNIDIVNNLCLPSCLDECLIKKIICEIWQIEKDLIESKKDVFLHFSELILPPSLDLSTLTLEELENKIREISKLENSIADLDCKIAKVLKALKELKICDNRD